MSDTPKIVSRHWLEYISTGAVLVISLLSLWVAIGSEDANQKMVAASSWPFLQINTSNGDGEGHSVLIFGVANSGVGPAKVKSLEVFWKGKAYPDSGALTKACCGYEVPRVDLAAANGVVPQGLMSSARIAHTVIRAGDSNPFLTLALTAQNGPVWKALDRERRSNMRFRICYCSVFDECWIDTFGFTGDAGAQRVDVCPVPKVPYDQ